MSNRLAGESSPYLLQHKDNPVDWFPWGEEALARAREEDRPILLSIGYSACHWCHVMERESFEDEQTAALMNERFVPIKLDREERPDLDAIYMEACQAMTGQGGWPLNVFLTPEQVPFYAGTYFPPERRTGMPSWRDVLEAVAEAWETRRDEIRSGSDRIAQRLQGAAALRPSGEPMDPRSLTEAVTGLRSQYDPAHGGFGGAPKFPPSSALEFLLRRGETEMVAHTLREMASGGMYDIVGGGFARYSVDARWRVPHFEKMLYDNALLARVYLHGWQVTGEKLFREVCEQTLDWALREMRGPEGVSSRRSTPTRRARRAGSTSGRSRTWKRRPARTRRAGSAPPSRATSRGRTSSYEARASPRRSRNGGAGCTTCAPSASGPLSTTSG